MESFELLELKRNMRSGLMAPASSLSSSSSPCKRVLPSDLCARPPARTQSAEAEEFRQLTCSRLGVDPSFPPYQIRARTATK